MGYRLPYLLFWRHCYFLWHFFRNKKMKGHPLPCLSLPPSPPFHLSPLRSHYPACIWLAGERASKSMAAVSWPWVSFLTLRGTELLGAQNVFSIPVCTTSHSSSFREERTSPGRRCASCTGHKLWLCWQRSRTTIGTRWCQWWGLHVGAGEEEQGRVVRS